MTIHDVMYIPTEWLGNVQVEFVYDYDPGVLYDSNGEGYPPYEDIKIVDVVDDDGRNLKLTPEQQEWIEDYIIDRIQEW